MAAAQLAKASEPEGYFQSKHTPGLWLHKTRDISFTPVVDDFGVKFTWKEDKDHLLNALEARYPVKVDDIESGILRSLSLKLCL